jgi:hypothetical protein
MQNYKAIRITSQECDEHLREAACRDKELLDQAEKLEKEYAEQTAGFEKFPEVAEETIRIQDENYAKPRTIAVNAVNSKTFTSEEFQKENAKRIRHETLRHTAQIAKGVVRHGNVRASRKTGRRTDSGGSSDDDEGSDSSGDSDPPGPGARAYHPFLVTPHPKENKPKYFDRRVSRRCWRVSRNTCGTQREGGRVV